MKKVCVIGGAGLIGIEISNKLIQRGFDVNLFDLGEQVNRVKDALDSKINIFYGSILDPSTLRNAIKNCDTVIHLAALLGVKRSEADKLRCLEINVEGTKTILDCVIQGGVEKFIFASSSEVYGEPLSNPISETHITQGKTIYAVSKLVGEEMCKAYSQRFGLNYVILRYFNCYGPYQTAQFVISKFIKEVIKGKSPIINGDGNQLRSYTYVRDTAEATILCISEKKAVNKILNIGNGKNPISIISLANKIISQAGKIGIIEPKFLKDFSDADRSADREIFERFCDSTLARETLNWDPVVTLDEGISKVIQNGTIFDRWEDTYDE
jgi:nucleoside-diphosphate-sugar epimerase